jgi:2-deoxy-D-gluconate 3-dehydrogenase
MVNNKQGTPVHQSSEFIVQINDALPEESEFNTNNMEVMKMASSSIFDVAGKHVIVTGGTRGIGRGVAEGFLENGCKVVLMGSNEEKLEKTVAENKAKGYDAYAVSGDLTVLENMDRMFKEAMVHLGGILDVMCPVAGTQHRCPPEEFPIEKFLEIQKLNVLHTYRMSQLALQVMLKQTGRGRGKIILMGSVGSFTVGQNISAYHTSKGAVAMMTKAIACDCASRNINVNMVAPGYVDTEILDSMDPAKKAGLAEKIPQGRLGSLNDIKGPYIFLASAASDYMNGELMLVDGGLGSRH